MPVSEEQTDEVLGICVALFNAAPGADNLATLSELLAEGMTVRELSALLAGSTLFQETVAGLETPEGQAGLLLSNFGLTNLGSTAYYIAREAMVGLINEGQDLGTVAYEMVSVLNAVRSQISDGTATEVGQLYADTVNIFDNKVEVARHHSITMGINASDLTELQSALAGVTEDPDSVTAAREAIDSGDAMAQAQGMSELEGTWLLDGETHSGIVTFLDNGTYYFSNIGTSGESFQSGVEMGAYTLNSGTGAFAVTPQVDTDGSWGFSDASGGMVAVVRGTTLIVYDTARVTTFNRLYSASESGARAGAGSDSGTRTDTSSSDGAELARPPVVDLLPPLELTGLVPLLVEGG